MRVRVVDFIIEELRKSGAESIFFVPGTGCMFLTDALARNEQVKSVSVHHEQAAGMAAISYAKYTNGLGACVVTTGCGGTNAITPLLDAWQDSVPAIFVSGQANRNQTVRNAPVPLRQMGRQEADIIAIVESISKYAVMLNDPDTIVYEVEKAIYIAQEGRKGPCWIDIPMDIQNTVIDLETQSHYIPEKVLIKNTLTNYDKEYVYEALKASKRPVILAGNGIRLANGVGTFNQFVEKFKVPVVYSRLGHDLIETSNDLSIGMIGMLGASRAGNFAIQNSDLVLCVGCRLSIDTTGYEFHKFAREAKLIVIDIDEVEHSKETVKIDHFIHSDAREFFDSLNKEPGLQLWAAWREKCLHWKNIFPMITETALENEKIDMYYFTEALSPVLPEGATVVSDAGNTFFTVSPVIKIKNGQRSITSGCQAEMGYALPAAIGISYASEGMVIVINGDGSVMMNIQELQTLAHEQCNVKVFIMNNNGYSSIRYLQNSAFRGRTIGCDSTSGISFPEFELLAKAFRLPYVKIEGPEALSSKIKDVLDLEGPVVCEVICVEEQGFISVGTTFNSKKRYVTRPLEDQSPWIDREQFLSEMIIEPIDQ